MRVLYVSADFGVPVLGFKGASVHVRELTDALVRLGHDVVIVTPNEGAGNEAHARVLHVPVQGLPRGVSTLLRAAGAPWGNGKRVEREVRELMYNGTLRQAVARLAAEWMPQLIYERYALFGVAGRRLSSMLGVPHVLEVNAPLRLERQRTKGLVLEPVAQWAERRIFGSADRIACVSQAMASYVVERGVASDRVYIQPNAVDTAKFTATRDVSELRARLGFSAQDVVVGFVGSLKSWHGVEDLVGAFARARLECGALRLLIVGDGPMRAAIENMVVECGVDQVTVLTGNVAYTEIPQYIGAMDIAVAPYRPSPDFYFSPLKLFEYMAAGRPVIAPTLGQIPDVVRDGVNGLLYAPGDLDRLVVQLARLCADEGLRGALGGKAAEDVRAHHSWDVVARRLMEQINASAGS